MPHRLRLIAAVDLGSSSFRMVIGRVEEINNHAQIHLVDSMREPVRLGAGLGPDKRLDRASQSRAFVALQRFGERLRSFAPDNVRAVATNAVRVARNAKDFLATAEAALGFPIEVIGGQEEARLVYSGVAHLLPLDRGRRLVVDVGGGSTEFIIGDDFEPIALESLYVGCVSSSEKFFSGGIITTKAMREAIMATRKEVEVLHRDFVQLGWTHAVGSSGTARALSELLIANGLGTQGITRSGLESLKDIFIRSGDVNKLKLEGLRPDRLPVIAGGLAVMLGVLEEFNIDQMEVTDGGLRQGVLYDILGRKLQQDMRQFTVQQLMHRYTVDKLHAERVSTLATDILKQIASGSEEEMQTLICHVDWASQLHEIGLTISHNGYHKHSAYILRNADMPGFSKPEQEAIANIVLGHTGKLGKLANVVNYENQWLAVLALRLATLFYRRRVVEAVPNFKITRKDNHLRVQLPQRWLHDHPLTEYSLETESSEWRKVGWRFEIVQQS